MSDVIVKEIDGVGYVLKLFPTMTGLGFISRMEREGMSPEVIRDMIIKGCSIGSIGMTEAKFNTQFAGKYKEMMQLWVEISKYNNLFPEGEGEEGNGEGSGE